MPSVGLVLVVRAGSPSFVESIKSARAMVDHVTVVAADDTSIIPGVAEGCATHVVKMPASMADARNLALSLAGEHGTDYFLMLDPGDTLEGGLPRLLDADLYEVWAHDRDHRALDIRLFRADAGVRYEGAESERLVAPPGAARSIATTLVYHRAGNDAAQRQAKARSHAADLLDWIADHPTDGRAFFTLAQSYKDAGAMDQAAVWFERRLSFDDRDNEECFVSALELAFLAEHHDKKGPADVMAAYLRAHEYKPLRAEPLFHLACYLRESGAVASAWHFARRASELKVSDIVGTSTDVEIYEWKALAELAIESWLLGDRATAMQLLVQVGRKRPDYKQWADEQLAMVTTQEPPERMLAWQPQTKE